MKTAFLFAHYHVSLHNSQLVKKEGNNLIFRYSGNKLPVALIKNYQLDLNLLIQVLNNKAVEIKSASSKGFVASVGNCHINIFSVFNLFTLNEIFIDTLYGLHTTEQDLVVLDIGMNVGIASLYFASLPNVKKVIGFEPFTETYKEALDNFELNEAFSDKIVAHSYGISNRTGELIVPSLESGSAVSSTNEQFIQSNQSPTSSNTTTVEIRSIDEVMDSLVKENPSQPIYLKIDCEGEEYVIFDKLDKSGYLEKISGFLLEWHLNGPESLITHLEKYNFKVLSLPINTKNDPGMAVAGMLYAFK